MFDKCGIFGASADSREHNIARDIYNGGVANNHRGFEGFGIIAKCRNQEKPFTFWGNGKVKQSFIHKLIEFEKLEPYTGMIHNRYSTATRDSILADNHPISLDVSNITLDKTPEVNLKHGAYIIHNGDVGYYLTAELKQLINEKFRLTSKTDTAILGQLYMMLLHLDRDNDPIAAGVKLMRCIPESYSMMIMYDNNLIIVRDPYGKKPLSLGFGDKVIYASSEDRAFKNHGINIKRHFSIRPFSIFHLRNGIMADSRERSLSAFTNGHTRHFCMFEDIYTARLDTVLKKNTTYQIRENRGKILGKELAPVLKAHGIIPDIATQVPVSAEAYATGVAYTLKIPYDDLLIKVSGSKPVTAEIVRLTDYERGYLKKTTSERREFTEKSYMLNPDRAFENLKGKTVILVDDSIVRGNTLFKPIQILREAGVAKVIVAIGSPPLINTCYGGNDFTRDQLAAYDKESGRIRTIEEINKRFVGADLLYYISKKGMINASDYNKNEVCINCWSEKIWKPKADLGPLITALKEF